jgi:hypothetical protein
MTTSVLSSAQADFEVTLLNADAESVSSSDFYLWLRESGLPSEVVIRLKNFVDTTAMIGNRLISIGKIILMKIIEFVRAHPNMVIGIAVGAAIGALVSMIPFLGIYLAPIVTVISTSVGAIAGHRLDKLENGQVVNTEVNLVAITQDVIEIAKMFFKLLIDIFNTLFGEKLLQGV